MEIQPEILYLKDRGEIWSDLIAGFHSHSYKLNLVRTVEDVLEAIARKQLAVLVVDASYNEYEADKREAQLEEIVHEVLHQALQIPIVFISDHASRRTQELQSKYDRFIAIDTPFVVSEVVRSVRSAVRAVLALSTLHGSSPARRSTTEPQALIAASQFRKIVDPTKLGNVRGGWTLSRGSQLSDFDDAVLVPPHPEKRVLIAALEEVTDEDLWLGLHARRAAFAASAVSNQLGRNLERDNNIRATAFLISWGLLNQLPKHRRVSLLGGNENTARELFSSALRESAEKASEKIRDQAPIRTMVAMASLLMNERFSENQDLVQDARFALATEIIDRACWGDGVWSPHGAYHVLNEFKFGTHNYLSGPIITGFSRLVVEAAQANPISGNTIPREKHELRQREVRAAKALAEAEKRFGKSASRVVSLAELKPRMRLTRPLMSFDGSVVLPANVELNPDMIMQVWRLAAIRPLELNAQIATDAIA